MNILNYINQNKKDFIIFFILCAEIFVFHATAKNRIYISTFILMPLISLIGTYYFLDKQIIEVAKRIVKNNLVYFIFILYLVTTLFYSPVTVYGVSKILGLTIFILPISIKILYLKENSSKEILKQFAYIIILTGIILSVILFYLWPIKYDGTKSFLIWSHNGLGRYLAFSIITYIILYHSIKIESVKERIFYYSIYFIIYLALYLTALRAAYYGVHIVLVLYYLFNYKNKNLKMDYLFYIIVFVIIQIADKYLFSNITVDRFKIIEGLSKSVISNDASLGARLIMWRESVEVIKNNFIFGIGIGGYPSVSKIAAQLLYPHNIILELFLETGLIGITFFTYLFLNTLKILIVKKDILFYFFIIYSFYSLFAGDIESQKIIFISVLLNNISKNEKN